MATVLLHTTVLYIRIQVITVTTTANSLVLHSFCVLVVIVGEDGAMDICTEDVQVGERTGAFYGGCNIML